ncbi:MAG: hypothetical protein ACLPPV_09460 [Candidatus Korobacteraceae bacterium]|jgi:hypothetical protein
MRRSLLLFALLTVSIMATAPAQAQRAVGGARVSVSGGTHPGGGHGFPNGDRRGYGRYRNYGSYYAPYYPYWDGGWDLPDSYEPPQQGASPPVIVMQSRDDSRSQPARIPESPKLIELPDSKDAAPPKPDVPALFVFANGKQLEARRYTITPDSLRVEIDRQQRTIPLGELNLEATIAANRERGIDLKVPTDGSQIFLGF